MNKEQKSYKKSHMSTWIQDSNGLGKPAIDWAEEFGNFLADNQGEAKMTTNQLRKFFDYLKRIQFDDYTRASSAKIQMLKPKIAYSVGRTKSVKRDRYTKKETVTVGKISYFYQEIKKAIDAIYHDDLKIEKQRFKNFVNLVEAIVAYHKLKGGAKI